MTGRTEPHDSRLNPAGDLEGASRADKAAIEQQSRASAVLIHETIRAEGQSELKRAVHALALSGLAAGMSMGLSLIVEGLLRAKLPDAGWRDLVAHLGYTVGFLVVVLGRQQLFTENTLTPVLPLLHHRDAVTLGRVLRLWGVVLGANVVGTWIVAAALARVDLFDPAVQDAFVAISAKSVEGAFWSTLAKGVMAGWIIALMVWLLPAAETARIAVIVILTYVVALGELAHVIAGSVDAAYLVLRGLATPGQYLVAFFVPTLLGNILGGVALVAILNYGQVASEVKGGQSP